MLIFLYVCLFALLFTFVQTLLMKRYQTTPYVELQKKTGVVKNDYRVQSFLQEKRRSLKRQGADILLRDGLTVSQWYLYKMVVMVAAFMIAMFATKGLIKTDVWFLLSVVIGVIGWFFLDLFVRMENKSSNEAMMADVMEMSRSVLYGKRGGQYITDALKDAVLVVENKRLKTALIKLDNGLDSGKSLDECLDELEASFSNGEIAAFCTVIKSLQTTGQVDEALKTLESNIEREQISVNKRRCVLLENKTMMYVRLLAFDLLSVILYCIIMKLLALQIGF
jgi:hypothetical protein